MNRCKHAYEFFPSVRVSLVLYISSFYSEHKRSSSSTVVQNLFFYEDETSAEFVGNVSFKINDDRGQKSIQDVTMSEFIRFSSSSSSVHFHYLHLNMLFCVVCIPMPLSLYLVYIRVLVIILFFSFCFQSHTFRSFGFFTKTNRNKEANVLSRRIDIRTMGCWTPNFWCNIERVICVSERTKGRPQRFRFYLGRERSHFSTMFHDWTTFIQAFIAGLVSFSLTAHLLGRFIAGKTEHKHWERTHVATSLIHALVTSVLCVAS